MKFLIFLSLISTFVFQNAFAQGFKRETLELAALMEGNFNTKNQSLIDSGYFDIRLHMKRIWTEREDAVWLYVEQSAASSPDKPYRQRIYRLTNKDYNLFESAIFELAEPHRFVGEWKSPNAGKTIDPESLIPLEGCSVYLKKVGEQMYSGSTVADNCLTDWRGAKHVSSIVTVLKNGLITWDRGFDENDNYLWGAEKAGYFFERE